MIALALAALRVMSIGECPDQLVLALLPPRDIASVSWLSRDPGTSRMAAAAARVPVNHGLVEEVLRDTPDLVIADSFAVPATRALLKRLGIPLVEVDSPQTIAGIRSATRQVARAVGEPARGEALVAHLDAGLAELAATPGPRVRVAAWDGGGFGAARGGLFDTVLTLAGADNIARDARRDGPDLEALLVADPDAIVTGGAANDLRANVAAHPVVRRWGGRRVSVPASATFCGTPFLADAALALRRQLAAVAPAAR